MRAAHDVRKKTTQFIVSGLVFIILGAGLSACGKRGEPLRPSEAELEQSSTG